MTSCQIGTHDVQMHFTECLRANNRFATLQVFLPVRIFFCSSAVIVHRAPAKSVGQTGLTSTVLATVLRRQNASIRENGDLRYHTENKGLLSVSAFVEVVLPELDVAQSTDQTRSVSRAGGLYPPAP